MLSGHRSADPLAGPFRLTRSSHALAHAVGEMALDPLSAGPLGGLLGGLLGGPLLQLGGLLLLLGSLVGYQSLATAFLPAVAGTLVELGRPRSIDAAHFLFDWATRPAESHLSTAVVVAVAEELAGHRLSGIAVTLKTVTRPAICIG